MVGHLVALNKKRSYFFPQNHFISLFSFSGRTSSLTSSSVLEGQPGFNLDKLHMYRKPQMSSFHKVIERLQIPSIIEDMSVNQARVSAGSRIARFFIKKLIGLANGRIKG